MSEPKTKCERCRHKYRSLEVDGTKLQCTVDGWEDDKIKDITEQDCETCERFRSKYVEFPIEVSEVKYRYFDYWNDTSCGKLVKVRPCKEEYGDKTYLGILLGDLPYMQYITHDDKTNVMEVSYNSNPAIFVPELKKIIFGMESWWSTINSPDDLKDISDEDIENIWYVKVLKEMTQGE